MHVFQLVDLELAEKHGRANKIMRLYGKVLSNLVRCNCCNVPLDQEKFPFMRDIDSLKELGSSFPLYFYVTKLMIIALSVCFFVACLPACLALSPTGLLGSLLNGGSIHIST